MITKIPTHRPPTHPGEMLQEEFLIPMGITQNQLADAIHLPYELVNEIINGRCGITSSIALRLAVYFEMSASFWLNLQQSWDLYYVQQEEMETINSIKSYKR
jgi:addiction module HigA family antidote